MENHGVLTTSQLIFSSRRSCASSACSRFLQIRSEIQLQAELKDTHRLTQAADLPDSWSIGNNRIVGGVTQAIWLSELRRVERVKGFGAKLHLCPFAQEPKIPVLCQ